MTRMGIVILVGSWAPLVAVGLTDPASNPIGLGLLAMGGSLAGVALIVVGLLSTLFRGKS